MHSAVDLSAVRAALSDRPIVGHIAAGLQTAAASYWVNVTNTGPVDSDDVVLGFLVPPGAGTNGTPLQQLFGFEVRVVCRGQESSLEGSGGNGSDSRSTRRGKACRDRDRAIMIATLLHGPRLSLPWGIQRRRHVNAAPRPPHVVIPSPAPSRHAQRVHVRAGQTLTVYLAANGVSFTQALADGSRVAWPGEYTVRFGVHETAEHGMGFAELKVLAQ